MGGDREPIRAHLLQIAIISNHLNGKDTHVRGVRIFAPKQSVVQSPLFSRFAGTHQFHRPRIVEGCIPFTSAAFQQHETIR